MSSSKSLATAATLLLLASFGVAAPVLATETNAGMEAVCASGTRVLFRSTGHPSKSMTYKRHEVRVPRLCSSASRDALVLASFVDGPGGVALMAGRAERAIEQIAKHESKDPAAALTNLCVAHTVLRQWSQSRDACDAAVAAALDERTRRKDWPGTRLPGADKSAAIAYSNRAVMHWLSRDKTAAANDLARARAIAPKAGFVIRNAELTALVPTHAQVRVQNGYAPIG